MSPAFRAIVFVLVLAASSLAMPTTQWVECHLGTWFYRCSNGYVGCFDYDPCNLPSKTANETVIASTTSVACTAISTSTDAATATTTTSTTTLNTTASTSITTTATCPSGKIFRPIMWNILPSQPDLSQPPVINIDIRADNKDEPELQQAIVFQGIPKEAIQCSLNWAQSDPDSRKFKVEGSGLIKTVQLSGFPASNSSVTFNSITLFDNPSSQSDSTNLDFTFWDQVEYSADTHIGSPRACAEDMYFKTSLNTVNGGGHVFMQQDAENGWFIEYSC